MVDANETRKTSSIPEITPLDRYDFGRAKICASVRWLLVTAYGSGEGVPADLQEPLSRDAAQHKQEKQQEEQLKPAVARLLLSCELYRRAYASVQQGAPAAEPKDHGGLLQALAKRGLEAAVSEGELSCQPIKVGAHMAVIDAMMTLATMETVGGVKMAKEVDQFGGGSTWENSLLFWVNKLIQKLRESTDTEGPGEVQKPQPTCTDLQPVQPSCPTRWYWKLVPHAIAFCLKESGNKPPVVTYLKTAFSQSSLSPSLH